MVWCLITWLLSFWIEIGKLIQDLKCQLLNWWNFYEEASKDWNKRFIWKFSWTLTLWGKWSQYNLSNAQQSYLFTWSMLSFWIERKRTEIRKILVYKVFRNVHKAYCRVQLKPTLWEMVNSLHLSHANKNPWNPQLSPF